MAIRMRRGNEADFDPSKMLPGEWAVSTDTKYVRMCFSPGIVLRMATYEAFESDMAEMRKILSECQSIKTAVELIQKNVTNSELVIENYVKEAKQYRDEAEQFRNEAFSTTPEGYEDLVKNVSDNTVKIDTVLEKAGLKFDNTVKGSNIHLTDSAESNVVALELYGKTEQNAYTGKNLLDCSKLVETTKNNVTFTPVYENGMLQYINVNGTASTGTSYGLGDFKLEGEFIASNLGGSYLKKSDGTWMKTIGEDESISIPAGSGNFLQAIIFIQANKVCNNLKFYPMISVEGGEYEPYVGGKPSPSPSYPQEIKSVVLNTIKTHGKNLIKGSQTFEDFDRMSIWTKETETYNGLTVLSKNTAWNGVFKKNFYVESGKTYTFSAFVKTSENNSAQLLLLYANISTAEISINSKPIDCTTEWKRFSITFTCTKSGLICPRVESITDGVRIYVCGYQVEESPTMTEYQPYQSTEITLSEPIELNGFNGVYDVVTSDGVTRKIKRRRLLRTDGWSVHSNGWIYTMSITDFKYGDTLIGSIYSPDDAFCTHLVYENNPNKITQEYSQGITMWYDTAYSGYRVAVYLPNMTSEEWLTLLDENKVYLVYELATPTTEELQTDFTALKTFYPETYVSNDADCDMSITYTADAKNYIDNKIALLTTAIYNNI